MSVRYLSCGDTAFTVEFGNEISPQINSQVMALHAAIGDAKAAGRLKGVIETVPSMRSLMVVYDVLATSRTELQPGIDALVAGGLKADMKSRRVTIPCCYDDPDFAPDLAEVAERTRKTPEQVIALHLASPFKVYALGFMPGFAYSAGLDQSLYLPRRSQPRVRVPRSSVAIAMNMSIVYSFESPGGWHLIGRTPLWMFDRRLARLPAHRSQDLRQDRARRRSREVRLVYPGEAMTAALKVLRAGLFDTVQDLGRIGFMALGMPTAGAMDRIALSLGNALVGNPAGSAGLEIGVMGPDLLVEVDSVRVGLVGPLSAALADEADAPAKPLESDRSYLLKRGQILRLGMVDGSSTAYLTIAGGLALPSFMGSLSTYSRAGIGGFDGRKLAAGDLLPLALEKAPSGDDRRLGAPFDYGSGPIRVIWGPQDDYFSARGRKTFVESEYRVSKEADRMGIRFEGPTIEHSKGADIISDGIGPGAIQVPGAGLPIVLLGDRQTVGGYSKIATVASVDLPRLGRMLPGRAVRFTAVTVEEAEKLRREQEARLARAIADLPVARPPGGIDLARLYEENLIGGIVYEAA